MVLGRYWRSLFLLSGVFLTSACGSDGEPLGATPTAGAGGDDAGQTQLALCRAAEPSPGPSPIRRMTRFEYNNTVYQLLGDNSRPADGFAPDEEALGFSNQAATLVVSPLLAEQYAEAAARLAKQNLAAVVAKVPSCDGEANAAACREEVETWLRTFAQRAYRRPATEAEISELLDLFNQGLGLGDSDYDVATGLELVLRAILQSPFFLYRTELGSQDAAPGAPVALTSHEMASRLSFLFWNSMPDQLLLERAEAGELTTPAQIETEARRLLAAPRAREAVKNFHREWLQLDEVPLIAGVGKDLEIYPDYSDALLPLFQKETEAFLDHAIFEEGASLQTLLTAPYTMLNRELAAFYGVSGPTTDAFERVELDPSKYSGFLTQPSLLAMHAKPNRSSPIHRGLFVRRNLLCQVPPSPPDIVPEAPEVDTSLTTREQFRQHEADPACAGCHKLIDPIGLGFEHFDGLGRYRETEWGLVIDASGEILSSEDSDGTFDGVIELGQVLADSEQVSNCLVTQWFRYAYGRAETDQDACTIAQLRADFAASGFDIKELLVALTQTDAFRYRTHPEQQP